MKSQKYFKVCNLKLKLNTFLHFQESTERISCTSPFGLKLDNICTEKDKSLEAYKLFNEVLYNDFEIEECPYPCNFLLNWITTTSYKDQAIRNILKFDKYIKVTTSTYGYTELELLAELGGYIGLFLGLSVFDLRLVFNKIFNIFRGPSI